MTLKTRIDVRSKDNAYFLIKDLSGKVVAKVEATQGSTTLGVSTRENYFIEKPSGWKSLNVRKGVC